MARLVCRHREEVLRFGGEPAGRVAAYHILVNARRSGLVVEVKQCLRVTDEDLG